MRADQEHEQEQERWMWETTMHWWVVVLAHVCRHAQLNATDSLLHQSERDVQIHDMRRRHRAVDPCGRAGGQPRGVGQPDVQVGRRGVRPAGGLSRV